MAEFRFHHLERLRVDQALPKLLEGAYDQGRRVVVRAASEEAVAALNDRLWTYDDASFLPHGAIGDGDPTAQPIFLTTRFGNPNAATMLVLLAGAEADELDDAFGDVIRLFDGRDDDAVAEARREWRRLKDGGRSLSYWRESEDGRWERAQ